MLESGIDMTSSNVTSNLRHRQALMEAAQFFKDAAQGMREDSPMVIVGLEIKSGLDALGEIIGETTNEEVLDRIFSQFCLGK